MRGRWDGPSVISQSLVTSHQAVAWSQKSCLEAGTRESSPQPPYVAPPLPPIGKHSHVAAARHPSVRSQFSQSAVSSHSVMINRLIGPILSPPISRYSKLPLPAIRQSGYGQSPVSSQSQLINRLIGPTLSPPIGRYSMLPLPAMRRSAWRTHSSTTGLPGGRIGGHTGQLTGM